MLHPGATCLGESWTGTNAVQVNDGLFHVMIGSLNPTLSSLSTTNVSLLYLGLTAGTDPEMSPRLQMGSAINAIRSESLLPGSNVHVASLTTAGSVGVGTQQPMEKLQVAGNIKADTFIGYGVVPVGSVIAWHKSLPGTPALPDGWVECNGQVIADPQSVYNGQTAPDLNIRGLFIRGSTVSGTYQADQLNRTRTKMPGTRTLLTILTTTTHGERRLLGLRIWLLPSGQSGVGSPNWASLLPLRWNRALWNGDSPRQYVDDLGDAYQ